MNLTKLFEVQKVLRDRINYNESDRIDKLILALLVESSECANEEKSFKFWSKNQQPRTVAVRNVAMMEEDKEYYNPLLEEFVDKLHFILELGLDFEMDIDMWTFEPIRHQSVARQFIKFNQEVTDFWEDPSEYGWAIIFETFLGLGEMLWFTWEQIETAYLEKNKINHQRQDSGVY